MQDLPEEQREAFPQLRTLSEEQQQTLRDKFIDTDELSFREYLVEVCLAYTTTAPLDYEL